MAFGEKAAQIEALTAQLAEAHQRLAQIEPFAGPAEAMRTEYDRLTRLANDDPARLPAEMYEEAVARVTAERRQQVIAAAAGSVAIERGAQIEREIIERDGPTIDEAARKRFAEEKEPKLRRRVEADVERRLTQERLEQLNRDRPAQIEAEYIAAHGEAITVTATERFEREQGPRLREEAEERARRNLTAAAHKQVTERISAEAALAALRAVENEERFNLRIKTIAENARRTHQIPMAHLAAGDAITVELCEVGQTFADPTSTASTSPKWTRQLRLSIVSPEHGIVMVLDDSWEAGSPPARRQAFRSGALLSIGTAVEVPPKAGAKAAEETSANPILLITRSVPLRAVHNEEDKTDPDFEVDRVYIDTKNGKQLLLGEEKTGRRNY